MHNGVASRLMDNGVASRRMEIGVASRRMENGVATICKYRHLRCTDTRLPPDRRACPERVAVHSRWGADLDQTRLDGRASSRTARLRRRAMQSSDVEPRH